MIRVLPINSKAKNKIIINTTSRDKQFGRDLSPFYLRTKIETNDGEKITTCVENAWQYSKVYSQFVNNDTILPEYFQWAKNGFLSTRANRYPMGKNKIPLFFLWKGERLGYIEARKKIYIPLYSQAVEQTTAFKFLKRLNNSGQDIILLDFDAYDHRKLNMSWEEVINCKTRKMGHAFVLAMLLEEYLFPP